MKKEHPILFNTLMCEAMLYRDKRQTRRTKGLEKVNINPDAFSFKGELEHICRIWNSDVEVNPNPLKTFFIFNSTDGFKNKIQCPYQVGDLLWVKETWTEGSDSLPIVFRAGYELEYRGKYDNVPFAYDIKWKSPLFLKKTDSRLWLQILSIRPERLHHISEEDAIAEGVLQSEKILGVQYYANYINDNNGYYLIAQESFLSLWTSINGKKSLTDNPWVWRIEFEVISKTGKKGI